MASGWGFSLPNLGLDQLQDIAGGLGEQLAKYKEDLEQTVESSLHSLEAVREENAAGEASASGPAKESTGCDTPGPPGPLDDSLSCSRIE
jgi:hypothetical protein